jgi:antitoxin PrlF
MMMATGTLSSDGQISIPLELRNELGLNPGDAVEFDKDASGNLVLIPLNRSVRRLRGMFGKFPRTISIEEMNEAVARGAAGLPEADGTKTY